MLTSKMIPPTGGFYAQTEESKPKMYKFGHVHIWLCPPPPKFLFILAFLFVNPFQYFGDFCPKAAPAGMEKHSVSYIEKQKSLRIL